MAGLYAEQAESAPAEGRGAAGSGRPGRHKAAAHEARGAPTFAVTSGPAATPIADTVEAALSDGIPVELVVLAVRTAELATGDTDPVAERERASDRERTRGASAKAPPAESHLAPPTPQLRSRRLRARNGSEPAVRTSVKPSIQTNDNLINRTGAVRLCRPTQSMFKQSTDNGGCK